jgi:hypothetical protein
VAPFLFSTQALIKDDLRIISPSLYRVLDQYDAIVAHRTQHTAHRPVWLGMPGGIGHTPEQ